MAIFTAATFDAGANSALDMGTLNISGMFGYNGRTHNSIKEFSPGTDYNTTWAL